MLSVIDHFTRFTQFYATRTKSSQAAAAKIWNDFIPRFGFPGKIHHDQGPEFNSNLWKELHRYSDVLASNTTPYHPQGDGMAERINRTVQNMLKSLKAQEKLNWQQHLPKLAFAYNSTVNKTTGYSPFFLMFGRDSILPVDSMFGLDREDEVAVSRKSHAQFVDEWKQSLLKAYQLANENINKSAQYSKRHYDLKVKGVELKVGDRVLMRNVREKGGTGKLKNHWESSLFRITSKKENLPVYTIVNCDNVKDQRTVHRNLLMECNDLPDDVFRDSRPVVKVPKKRGRPKKVQPSGEEDDNIDLDEDNILVILHEGVADSSGGGSGASHQVIETDPGGDQSADPTDPDALVEDEHAVDPSFTDDEYDPEPVPQRRSLRPARPPEWLAYHQMGGPPNLVDLD